MWIIATREGEAKLPRKMSSICLLKNISRAESQNVHINAVNYYKATRQGNFRLSQPISQIKSWSQCWLNVDHYSYGFTSGRLAKVSPLIIFSSASLSGSSPKSCQVKRQVILQFEKHVYMGMPLLAALSAQSAHVWKAHENVGSS